jgi:hypothetical protein
MGIGIFAETNFFKLQVLEIWVVHVVVALLVLLLSEKAIQVKNRLVA